jgi:hypothetical protein
MKLARPLMCQLRPKQRFGLEWDVAGEQLRSMLRRRRDVLVHHRVHIERHAARDRTMTKAQIDHEAILCEVECVAGFPGNAQRMKIEMLLAAPVNASRQNPILATNASRQGPGQRGAWDQVRQIERCRSPCAQPLR